MAFDHGCVRGQRWAVAAVAVAAIAAGCGDPGGSAGPSPTAAPSEDAAAPTASTTPTPEASTTADVAPEDLFAPLPEGYAWVEASPQVADEVRANVRQGHAGQVIDAVAVRDVEYGSVPAGTMVALTWTRRASSAVRGQFVDGLAGAAGVEPEAVQLDGHPATRLDADPTAYVHTADHHAVVLFGQDDQRLRDVMTAVLAEAS